MQAVQQVATRGHNFPPTEAELLQEKLTEKESGIRAAILDIENTPLPSEIGDEKSAGEVTERIKTLGRIGKSVEEAHKETKAPFWECCKTADNWKNGLESEIKKLKSLASVPLNQYLDRKEEEERKRQQEIARQERENAERLAAEAAAHQTAKIEDVAEELLDDALRSEGMAERIEMNVLHARPADLAKSRSAYGSTASRKQAWVGRITSLSGIDLEKLRPYLNEEAIQKALNAFVKNGGRDCAGATIKEEITGLNIR